MSADLKGLDPRNLISSNAEKWLLTKGAEWVCYLISIDDEVATYLTAHGVCEVGVPATTAKNGVENYLREGWALFEPDSGGARQSYSKGGVE